MRKKYIEHYNIGSMKIVHCVIINRKETEIGMLVILTVSY